MDSPVFAGQLRLIFDCKGVLCIASIGRATRGEVTMRNCQATNPHSVKSP